MSRELENLAKDLRKFLASADEEDFILKAAPKPKRADKCEEALGYIAKARG